MNRRPKTLSALTLMQNIFAYLLLAHIVYSQAICYNVILLPTFCWNDCTRGLLESVITLKRLFAQAYHHCVDAHVSPMPVHNNIVHLTQILAVLLEINQSSFNYYY